MEEAIKEAVKAYKRNEVPVGAVIVKNNKILAKARNKRQSTNNVLGHAEIIALMKAQKKLKDWRLYDCDLYVTLKPCELCESAIKESRLSNVFYLAEKGEHKKQYNQTVIKKTDESSNETEEKYISLLSRFFENKR